MGRSCKEDEDEEELEVQSRVINKLGEVEVGDERNDSLFGVEGWSG